MSRVVISLALVLMTSLAPVPPVYADSSARIGVEVPWIRSVPPAARMSAAYMVLENPAERDDRLVGASCEIAESVELHNISGEGGMMLMYPVEGIALPAGRRVVLKPGGFHIMLIGLTRVPAPGEEVSFTLNFERAGEQRVRIPVREKAP